MNKKKKHLKRFAPLGIIFVGLIGYGVYWAFFDMGRLPKGEFLTEETSPDGKYTIKAYVVNGGATTSYSIRGELHFNEKRNKTKTIYWNYHEKTATITWINKDNVNINEHTLHLPTDHFDFRHP
ncbi:MAG: DUF5412 domain-containing protein [Bacillus sp. (in: firmicutes)]